MTDNRVIAAASGAPPAPEKRLRDRAIRVLVVDDELSIRRLLQQGLGREGFDVTVHSGVEELDPSTLSGFDVMILDHRLSGRTGLQILNDLHDVGRSPEVIMVTGYPTVQVAVQAMKKGAFDFISKPFRISKMAQVVRNASERRRLARENVVLRSMVAQQPFLGPVIAESDQLKAILNQVESVAPFRTPVLITGETGTGKGLMAKTLHQVSDRVKEPFLQINCSTLQEQLFESELFGHKKGAFTGASSNKPGLFEVADGGTLFLDEIGEMSLPLQAKLLQVLDTGEFRSVGDTSMCKVDVRIVAATNRDLKQEVREKRFRSDLFYRLNVIRIEVPPLRRRKEDIVGLVQHYLQRFQRPGRDPKILSQPALEYLREYAWPGNVRELANVVETLVLLSPGETITPEDLPSNICPDLSSTESRVSNAPLSLQEMERLHIIRTLEFTGGKKARAARILKIDVKTLSRKIQSYDIAV